MKLPFLQSVKQSGEIYCGLLLKEGQGVCYVYEKKESSVALLKQKEFQYSNGWEHIVDDIDDALSIIEQELGTQTSITQCIFFVFAHIIDQSTHEIGKAYITKFRDISKLLELKPVGYMEVIDAVHEEIEHEKQSRLSSIVVELDDTQMTVFLFKGGHKIAVQKATRTDNFTEDMQSALEKIAQSHILPNHIYLYDSTDLAEESSDLLLYSWKKNLFIQQPRITVIPASKVSNALLKLLEKQLCEKPQAHEAKEVETQKSEVMGFTIGREVVEDEAYREEVTQTPFKLNLPQLSLPRISLPKLSYLLIPLSIFGLLIAFLYFIHSATIHITLPQQKESAEIVILASKKPTKPEQVELQTFTASFSASEKKDTTGKKDIGERAMGEVTLYSYEEKERALSKGTKISLNSISYETDDAVTIPSSQFASDGITKNPGKAKVKVRASALGTESNIEKNKRFSVADLSSNTVFGINESNITGGTKKTVRTISKLDLENIKTFVMDKAKEDALKKQKGDSDFVLLPDLATAKAVKETYSGEVGEEADVLKYTTTGEVVISRLPKSAIKSFVEKKLESKKPEGYAIGTVSFSVKKQKKVETGDMQLTIGGEIQFNKAIQESAITEALVGKEIAVSKEDIKSKFGIEKFTIEVRPAFPIIQDRLPFWQNHIRVEVLK